MYAVIKTGGKQYKVAANEKILIEKLEGEAGDQIQFHDVFMVVNGAEVHVGAPTVAGAIVMGEIEKQARGPKLIIFKKRRRKHYRRRNGHRQDLTSVMITEILTGGAKPVAKAKATAPAASPVALMAASAPVAHAGAKPDDLSLISGVGPKSEKALHELGYTTFAQIAAWTKTEIDNVEHHIKLGGRVEREEWVQQAKELMDGKPPRAKVDRAHKKATEEIK